MLGEPETTIGMKYECTQDGRNAAVHERSVVAGSGDPKRTAEAAKKTSVDTKVARAETHSKTSPESRPAARPGTPSRAASARPSRGGPGDKAEVHVSEEELGVTTPERSDA
jgi:hypothetical protein